MLHGVEKLAILSLKHSWWPNARASSIFMASSRLIFLPSLFSSSSSRLSCFIHPFCHYLRLHVPSSFFSLRCKQGKQSHFLAAHALCLRLFCIICLSVFIYVFPTLFFFLWGGDGYDLSSHSIYLSFIAG